MTKEALEEFCDVVVKPVADGGEGSVEAMTDALDAKFIDTIVKNPLGTEILARYALKDDLVILEMSSTSGLTLINSNERNPMKTSTFGFGQMIKDAINKGANGRMVKQLDDGLKHFAGLVKERWQANFTLLAKFISN